MSDQISFVLKVLILSLGFSLLIKYLAPLIMISATGRNAFVIVIILPLSMTLLLFWKLFNDSANI